MTTIPLYRLCILILALATCIAKASSNQFDLINKDRDAYIEKLAENRHREENKAKFYPGYDAVLVGWPKENHPWITKTIAEKIFPDSHITTFGCVPNPMMDFHYRLMIGEEPDWEKYKIERKAELKALTQKLNLQKKEYEQQKHDQIIKNVTVFISIIACFFLVSYLYIIKDKILGVITTWQLHHWAVAGCVLLLLISIIGGDYDFLWKFYSLPYGYYTILRLAVTATAAYLCILAGKTKQHPAITVLAAALVLLFQPIARVTFEHDTWCWIDLITIPLLITLTYFIAKPRT